MKYTHLFHGCIIPEYHLREKISLYDKTKRFGFSQMQQRILLQCFHKQLGLVLAQPWLLVCKDLVLVEFVPRFNVFCGWLWSHTPCGSAGFLLFQKIQCALFPVYQYWLQKQSNTCSRCPWFDSELLIHANSLFHLPQTDTGVS